VFGKPSLFFGHDRGDPKRKALLAQQSVSAVTGTVGPDGFFFRKMRNVFFFNRCTGPLRTIGFTLCQGLTHGMKTGDEYTIFSQNIKDLCTNSGHDVHIRDNVRGIGNFNADLSNGRTHRTHAERDDVHRSALHTSVIEFSHGGL